MRVGNVGFVGTKAWRHERLSFNGGFVAYSNRVVRLNVKRVQGWDLGSPKERSMLFGDLP